MSVVYLDYNATTPTDPRVVEALLPYYTELPGNAASVDHAAGNEAHRAVEDAREQVAAFVGARAGEVVFTSGATEADNIAILGCLASADDDAELVVSAVEHPAVREAGLAWGGRLRVVRVDGHGIVDPDEVRRAISPRTALVSIMTANNESGAIQPIEEIAAVCDEAGVPLHTDAVQAAARLPRGGDVERAQLVSLSAHKMYGPKGIGALVVRRRRPRAQIVGLHRGGGQERGLRPGTLNVPGIVGFGVAAELARKQGAEDRAREQRLRDRLLEGLSQAWPKLRVNGDLTHTLPQTLNVRLPGIDAHAMLRLLAPHVALSTGSACTTTSVEPSHVLLAQGLTAEQASESLRISLGRFTTEQDVAVAVSAIAAALERLRPLARAAPPMT